MNKNIIGLTVIVIMSINIYGEASSEVNSSAKYEGNIRLGYQNHEVQNDRRDEFSTGLTLYFETASYRGLQIGTTLFSSQGNGKEGFEGIPFFDENNEKYTILGEAYLKGKFSNTTLILGRQSFDTPFADSDDIGMVPNTFEAFALVNKDLKDTTLFMAQVQKWSGVDSPVPSNFTDVNGDNGMQILGITYDGLNKAIVSGWFYNLSGEVKISYLEVNYKDETDKYTYGATMQYAFQDYNSGESSTIYGAAVFVGVNKVGLTITIAYNRTSGIAADNFFGGGPFVTNAEHYTLSEAGPDGNMILYTLEWDASVAGAEGLSLIVNIDDHHGSQYHASEYDLAMEYTYSDRVNFSAIYSDVDDRDDSFQNLRFFANYSF